MAAKIKKGDQVVVITGKDRGRQGEVLRTVSDNRAVVESINMVSKHQKPNPNKNEQGGIVKREASIHLSNVAILNPVTKKADRVGFKTLENGDKVRYFKSNGEVIDVK